MPSRDETDEIPLAVIERLASLLNRCDLAALSLETKTGESRLDLRRAAPVSAASQPISRGEDGQDAPLQAAPGEAEAPTLDEASAGPLRDIVVAPCVGLFRTAPSGIEAGLKVRRKQLLGVVASLNVPNELYATRDGKIIALLAQDGQGVEWGQPLLEIEVDEPSSD